MKRICMLTLSIAEGIPGSKKFEVNCLHITNSKKGPIVSFELTKAEIFDPIGQAIWDLGRITLMEGIHLKKFQSVNKVYVPDGKVELLESKVITKEMLKDVLNHNVMEYDDFQSKKDLRFAVVKPRKIISIDEDAGDKGRRKQRMTLDFDDNHRQEKLLNKDYRWVHYWNQISEDEIWLKQDMYTNLFNEPEKDLYLIVTKYKFKGKPWPSTWISGMHWL